MNIGTRLFTKLKGRQIGSDAAGNLYFEEKRQRPGSLRNRRWVMYAGLVDASAVPPEWHSWLHYTTDATVAGHRAEDLAKAAPPEPHRDREQLPAARS